MANITINQQISRLVLPLTFGTHEVIKNKTRCGVVHWANKCQDIVYVLCVCLWVKGRLSWLQYLRCTRVVFVMLRMWAMSIFPFTLLLCWILNSFNIVGQRHVCVFTGHAGYVGFRKASSWRGNRRTIPTNCLQHSLLSKAVTWLTALNKSLSRRNFSVLTTWSGTNHSCKSCHIYYCPRSVGT